MSELYPIPAVDDKDDYLPDRALARIGALVARLPTDGFDVPSMQAHPKSVTATFKFDGAGPEAQLDALDAILNGATVLRTLYANLVAARDELRRIRGTS